MTADIVLWLDLAESNQMADNAIREHIPPGAPVLRLTERGAVQCPLGTPTQWRPVLDAIDRLVRDARKLERQLPGCRYWVTGRAGLPAFFHLGYRLSKIAAVTLVHQAKNGGEVAEMRLDASSGAAAAPYFERTPWPVPHTDATAPAALVISSLRRPAAHQIQDAMAALKTRVGGIVHAHSPARLDATTAGSAMREIEQTLQETCDAHPARSTLGVFIAGPSALAFLVGGAINPRACRDVQVFEFDGSRYSLAYELPYPPVPDRNRVLFFMSSPAGVPALALDEEIRSLRLERSGDTVADRLDIEDLPAARPKDVPDLLRKREPGVIHFSGHGETGELLFQDDDGNLRPVSTSDLAEILRLAGGSVRLVVLNACHSESHAEALLAYVDCVVAMRGRVRDTDARRFSSAFYRHLADGDSVRDTFDKAILAMRLERPAGPADSRTRDVEAADAGSSAEGEPPKLLERDPGCSSSVFLVRRR